jgi:hypothetical protein
VRRITRHCWYDGVARAASLAILLAGISETQGAWSGMYGCYSAPCVVSPLDMPLTPLNHAPPASLGRFPICLSCEAISTKPTLWMWMDER